LFSSPPSHLLRLNYFAVTPFSCVLPAWIWVSCLPSLPPSPLSPLFLPPRRWAFLFFHPGLFSRATVCRMVGKVICVAFPFLPLLFFLFLIPPFAFYPLALPPNPRRTFITRIGRRLTFTGVLLFFPLSPPRILELPLSYLYFFLWYRRTKDNSVEKGFFFREFFPDILAQASLALTCLLGFSVVNCLRMANREEVPFFFFSLHFITTVSGPIASSRPPPPFP